MKLSEGRSEGLPEEEGGALEEVSLPRQQGWVLCGSVEEGGELEELFPWFLGQQCWGKRERANCVAMSIIH